VAVATGGTTTARLAESGAHAVLPDLADTPAVLAAILGDSLITDDYPETQGIVRDHGRPGSELGDGDAGVG
jgi:hypothetical protein